MSAITETEPGGEMVCILGFETHPRAEDDKPGKTGLRKFNIGERVRYLYHYFVGRPEDNPLGYMAVFEPLDSKDKTKYEATQDYFVSLDCWDDLKEHFASNLIVTERGEADRPNQFSYALKKYTPKKVRRPAPRRRKPHEI